MPRELNEGNLKEAYCKVIASTGVGAAEKNCDDVLPKHVWLVVPEPMHDDYPARLLACANQVCTNEPYGWKVDQTEPEVEDETTFHLLYEDWFKAIVWP
jgi:hypothetical protein